MRIEVHKTISPQLVVENTTRHTVEVLDDAGVPFLRIGPQGVEGNVAARAWGAIVDAYTRDDASQFNAEVSAFRKSLADDSAHLTPQTFGGELKKMSVDAPVYASHRKIPFERDIESQIRNLRDRRARVLLEKNYTL